jgi:hypothetical protein
MNTALKTTLLVAVALAGSITLAAAQQAGSTGGNGGRGSGDRGGSGGGTTSALDARSTAAPCVPGQTCRWPKPRVVKTKTEGECSCTYTRYTDADGYYYKKICIRFEGTSGRRLRCVPGL